MAKRTINLCDEIFTIVMDAKEPKRGWRSCDTLYQAYAKPSAEKVEIFDKWRAWKYQMGKTCSAIDMWISGHNAYKFTLEGYYVIDGAEFGFRITPTQKTVWRCV